MLGGFLNLKHTVESSVAHDIHLRDTDAFEQTLALLVLHEESGEALQHASISPAVPLEEHLPWAEDAAHAIRRDATMRQDMKEVAPELVLDEESHHRAHQAKESDGVQTSVYRHVADDVGSLVVLAHLIARRREEGKQNLVLRMLLADAFHQGSALLELAQRSRMKPHVLGMRVHLLLQYLESLTLASPHLAHLLIEKACYGDAEKDEIDYDIVNHRQNLLIWLYNFYWLFSRKIPCTEMLLPLQGALIASNITQGDALGLVRVGLSARFPRKRISPIS